MIGLTDHFGSSDRNRHSEWLRQRQWFIKAKNQHARREDIAEKLEDGLTALAVEVVMANEAQLRQFETRLADYEARLDEYYAKLDAYDEAVTRALIERLERLHLLEARHAELLTNAFVLEDGRKVFKSEDGTFVVDEAGEQLDADEIDPALIPDGYTTAEEFTASLDAIENEKAEIDALHQAQSEIDAGREKSGQAREKLDDAKDALNEDGITVQDLEDLEAELDEAMPTDMPSLPSSAIKQLSGLEETNGTLQAKVAFADKADPDERVSLGRHQSVPACEPTGS